MSNARAKEMMRKLIVGGGLFDFGPDRSRLLIQVWRSLAKGRPVTAERVDQIAADIGIARDEADQFLRQMSERDTDDNIVGVMGLSLNDHPHRFNVNGTRMSTWCAEDTLFLPAMLKQTATIESDSPLSKEKVRLTVSADAVEEASPAGAMVSIVVIDPDKADISSTPAIWGTFCHHIFFFASRQEGEQWAAGRDDIEILSLDEGFELGKQIWSKVLAYA